LNQGPSRRYQKNELSELWKNKRKSSGREDPRRKVLFKITSCPYNY
jgi:hypothetical protein